MSTHGQFTIKDGENTHTLYTFANGGSEDAILDLYGLLPYWIQRSADNVRWLLGGDPETYQERVKSKEWKSRSEGPAWCLILLHKSPEALQAELDTPGEFEDNYRTGIRYDQTDAFGIGQLMTNRHMNRWYPYPLDYRSYPGDDFTVTLTPTGDGTMDFEMSIEFPDYEHESYNELREKLKAIPCLKFPKKGGLPTVNLGEQFWHVLREEMRTLIPFAGK